MSLSLSTIFGVVPVEISEWNPDTAPHAIVMKTNGYSGPGMTGPPPFTNCEKAGACSVGFTMITPRARNAIVPIFMNVLRYPRGVSNIHIGRIDAASA
jgi:hypothetical protein